VQETITKTERDGALESIGKEISTHHAHMVAGHSVFSICPFRFGNGICASFWTKVEVGQRDVDLASMRFPRVSFQASLLRQHSFLNHFSCPVNSKAYPIVSVSFQ
jgi:hypothetical protein